MKWFIVGRAVESLGAGAPVKPDGILTTTSHEKFFIWGAAENDSAKTSKLKKVLAFYDPDQEGGDGGMSDELDGETLLDALADLPEFASFSALAKPSPLPWILGGGAALALLAKLRK